MTVTAQTTLAEPTSTMHIRKALKIIRNPAMTAYDLLPNGETVGEFANRTAIESYTRNVENKRLRTRENRKKRKKRKIFQPQTLLHNAKKKRRITKD